MAINIDIFIVLSVPSFVVDVQQILSIARFDYHFNCGFAPDVFCVAGIDLLTCFDGVDDVTFDPFVVGLNAFIPSDVIGAVAFKFLPVSDHFDRVVNQQ